MLDQGARGIVLALYSSMPELLHGSAHLLLADHPTQTQTSCHLVLFHTALKEL